MIDDDKFGPKSVVDDGNDGQPWCLPVWVEKKGTYQLIVTARGEMGGDALPTLALAIDEEYQPQTTGRLATTEWQRLPVGHPVALDEGGHFISVRLRNGFSQGPEDKRSLFLQKYELVRLDAPPVVLAVNSGAGPGAAGPKISKKSRNGSGPMQVAFADNLDGQIVTGAVDVRARAWWPDRDHTPPPRVELYVNQRLVASQQSRNPRFLVDPAAFTPGANVLELRATLPSGGSVTSVPLTVQVPRDFPLPGHPFRPALSFTTYDSGLASTMTPPLAQPQPDPELATFASNAQSTVDLPADAAGNITS